jgi:N6-adenosine-specific RNA methylase IME4
MSQVCELLSTFSQAISFVYISLFCDITHVFRCNSNIKLLRELKKVGFEVFTTISWDKTPHSPLKVNIRFGGTYRLHLQG